MGRASGMLRRRVVAALVVAVAAAAGWTVPAQAAASGNGGTNIAPRYRDRLPQPRIRVLDSAAWWNVVGLAGVQLQFECDLEHDRPADRNLPLRCLGQAVGLERELGGACLAQSDLHLADGRAMHRRHLDLHSRLATAARHPGQSHRHRSRMPEPRLPVLDPGAWGLVDDPAGVQLERHGQLEHHRTADRHLPLRHLGQAVRLERRLAGAYLAQPDLHAEPLSQSAGHFHIDDDVFHDGVAVQGNVWKAETD